MLRTFFGGEKFNSRILPFLHIIVGSFFIAAGWSWYHFFRHPKLIFIGKAFILWLIVLATFFVGRKAFVLLVKKFRRHEFWSGKFLQFFEEIFFLSSLLFLIFFIEIEWFSLIYAAVVLFIIFYRVQAIITHHPGGQPWLAGNRSIFALAYFLFAVEALVQFTGYHYYILDNNVRFYNIVLFRSVAMTLFWLLGFAVASFWYWQWRGTMRWILLFIWSAIFAAVLSLWVVNIGILYYSGLYFSPIDLQYIDGSGAVVGNNLTYYLIAGALAIFVIFLIMANRAVRTQKFIGRRNSSFYLAMIAGLAVLAFFGVSSFRNTPERAIAASFYNYFFGKNEQLTLDPAIKKKLEKFGLFFKPDQFYVNDRAQVFTPTSTKFLPDRLLKNKPNILIVYVESFSARLSDVYSSKFPGVTPNFKAFADDPHSTVFHNYYNASTPTITGTLSQLCSFLPTTGYEEIQIEKKLQNHHLLCLPEVLKKDAGFKYSAYVTAVDKEFENKDGIFTSAGVDKIYGTAELKKYIKGPELSWGYSDHQLFPAVWNFMQTAPQPFLMMLATVDSHPPFNLAKDAVNYGDGSKPVLNMFHTTDDAFGKFWDQFKQSPFYQNTIVIAVADHAIFPGALTTDLFPAEAKTLTYYDQNFFTMYVPDSVLPRTVDVYSSGIDEMPTLLQLLNINVKNSFEGHSIFDDRKNYPNLLGMHELGLYINVTSTGKRQELYDVPSQIDCPENYSPSSTPNFTLCDYKQFYDWKRQMFEQGRFWKH